MAVEAGSAREAEAIEAWQGRKEWERLGSPFGRREWERDRGPWERALAGESGESPTRGDACGDAVRQVLAQR
jgi:hypothetical protein